MNEPDKRSVHSDDRIGWILAAVLVRGLGILLGAFSVFGSLFIGALTPSAVGGVLIGVAALIPARRRDGTDKNARIMLALAAVAFLSQVLDVVFYYWKLDIPGNYYWWPGSVAFFVLILLMAVYALAVRRRVTGPDSIEG